MFLICELNDEDYTEPVFRVCETKEKAFEESMKRLDDLAKKEGSELKVSYHGIIAKMGMILMLRISDETFKNSNFNYDDIVSIRIENIEDGISYE